MEALNKANQARSRTAKLKLEIKRFHVDPRDLINEAPDHPALQVVTTYDFLTWIPWIGPSKATRILMKNPRISPTVLLRDLSAPTQGVLIQRLHDTIHSPHRTRAYIVKPPPLLHVVAA